VRIFPDFEKLAARLKDIPAPLRSKQLNTLDARFEGMGIRHRSNGIDKDGNRYVDCDIRPGTSLQQIYEFCQVSDTAAVDLEPADVEAIYGKNPVSLGMRRYLEIQGTQDVQRLEPDRLTDALLSVRQKSWGSGEPDEVSDRFAAEDLVMQGHLSQAEADSVDDFLEAKPQGIGLTYVGDTARRYTEDSDLGEFAIDPDVAEWEGF
jgi:hypothetical protein